MEERIGKAQSELSFEPQFDTSLVNDTLETSLEQAKALVNTFLSTDK